MPGVFPAILNIRRAIPRLKSEFAGALTGSVSAVFASVEFPCLQGNYQGSGAI
jgi:hypothetical protein